MDWFRSISLFYQWKCYENQDVAKFVRFEKITPKQYKEITKKNIQQTLNRRFYFASFKDAQSEGVGECSGNGFDSIFNDTRTVCGVVLLGAVLRIKHNKGTRKQAQ